MDIEEFILIVGGILIVAVIAHGLWIGQRKRKDDMPYRPMTDPAEVGGKGLGQDLHRWELPNGGGRPVEPTQPPARRDGPRQRSFVLDEPLPRGPKPAAALRREMDEELLGRSAPAAPVSRDLFEPAVDSVDPDLTDGGDLRAEVTATDQLAAERAGVVEVTLPTQAATLGTENRQSERGRVHNAPPAANQPLSDEEPSAYGEPSARKEPSAQKQPTTPVTARTPRAGSVGERPADPEDVIVLYLLAPEGERFAGNVICTSLMQHGLKFGDTGLFHRLQSDQAQPTFSVVNIVNPGFFDLAAIEDLTTPGIAFYMTLPGPEDPLAAFDDMVRIAQRLCGAVQGRLMDDSRSMITLQTISHLRERVTGFHLRNYSRRA